VGVPLRPPHDDVPLDLGAVLSETYDRARYAQSVDYSRDAPPPPLNEADAAWVRERIDTFRAGHEAQGTIT